VIHGLLSCVLMAGPAGSVTAIASEIGGKPLLNSSTATHPGDQHRQRRAPAARAQCVYRNPQGQRGLFACSVGRSSPGRVLHAALFRGGDRRISLLGGKQSALTLRIPVYALSPRGRRSSLAVLIAWVRCGGGIQEGLATDFRRDRRLTDPPDPHEEQLSKPMYHRGGVDPLSSVRMARDVVAGPDDLQGSGPGGR